MTANYRHIQPEWGQIWSIYAVAQPVPVSCRNLEQQTSSDEQLNAGFTPP